MKLPVGLVSLPVPCNQPQVVNQNKTETPLVSCEFSAFERISVIRNRGIIDVNTALAKFSYNGIFPHLHPSIDLYESNGIPIKPSAANIRSTKLSAPISNEKIATVQFVPIFDKYLEQRLLSYAGRAAK